MSYYSIVKDNARKFTGDESVMWASIEQVSDLLEEIKESHPDIYWAFMRKAHELMFGKHFDKHYAKYEVEKMSHVGDDGRTYDGEHWSREQTNNVMSQYRTKLPAEVNEYDFYVALNNHWHDTVCTAKRHFSSEADAEAYIIDEAVAVWFNDSDWGDSTKVWEYFSAKRKEH